jgi:very-short-patch-repair endonuclease
VVRKDASGRRRHFDCEWNLPDGRVLVLEIDGSFHMHTENWWKDMQRERSVVTGGGVVLRCASVEIRLEPGRIAGDLLAMGVPLVASGFVRDQSA